MTKEKKFYRVLIEFQYQAEDEDDAIEQFIEDCEDLGVTESDWIIVEAPELKALHR
jgi:hypothetical protein